jgi:hypothetical protein
MTTSAWITMLTAWTIITYFMLRFFIKVVRTPQEKKHSVKDA